MAVGNFVVAHTLSYALSRTHVATEEHATTDWVWTVDAAESAAGIASAVAHW